MDTEIYRVLMDGRWGLNDLYEFPHAYMQVYAFTYCFDSDLEPRDADRIDLALENYPWKGGYSIVNIYTVLQNQVEHRHRPVIAGIKYASPGWIDIQLCLQPAIKLAASVAAIAGSAAAIAKSYSATQKALHDIQVQADEARLKKIELTRDQLKALQSLTEELARITDFKRLNELNLRTKDLVVTSKLISAHYRRLKTLAEYVIEGKASLPDNKRDNDSPLK